MKWILKVMGATIVTGKVKKNSVRLKIIVVSWKSDLSVLLIVICTVTTVIVGTKICCKPLSRNDLGRNGAAPLDVTPYGSST